MTDKQIIIDGVDVSGCVHFIQEEKDCCNLGGNCKGWANCYYKNWKRKEQECERLTSTLTEIKEIAETENNDIKVLYNRRTYQRMKQILQKISEVEDEEV